MRDHAATGRSSRRPAFALALVALLLGASLSPVVPCCMVPTTYPGDVDQTRQQGIIFYHDGHEVLVLRVHPTFPDFDYGPVRLTWIITVPASPTGYDAIDAAIFDDAEQLYRRLEDLAEAQEPKLPKFLADSMAPAGSISRGLDISDEIRVGPYRITEVGVREGAGATELNEYLVGRDFPVEPVDEVSWFVERGFRFLCIEIDPPEGSDRFGKHAALPALQIEFPTERPYYPAKYSARQGDFALGLTVITSGPLDLAGLDETRRRLRSRVSAPAQNLYTGRPLPERLRAAAAVLPGGAEVERWTVNAVPSFGFNPTEGDTPAIARWTNDVFFSLGDRGDLPPNWYYGDLPWWQAPRYITKMILVTALVVLGLSFLVRRFRRRRPTPA